MRLRARLVITGWSITCLAICGVLVLARVHEPAHVVVDEHPSPTRERVRETPVLEGRSVDRNVRAPRSATKQLRSDLVEGLHALPLASCNAQGAVFILDLATLDGSVQIESADLLPTASIGDSALACVHAVLAGRVLPAPTAKAGRRTRMAFPIGEPAAPSAVSAPRLPEP
ncbi:MAG: hypothetical protein JWO36_2488 [Myxococcales bacterium]|nr:hypothetical protein [Myxococcales bacterium]